MNTPTFTPSDIETRFAGKSTVSRTIISIPAVLLATVVALFAQSAGATPTEWKVSDGGNGHFYEVVVVSKGVTWSGAQTLAFSKGGYLATLTSAAENAFVYALAAPDKVPGAWDGGTGPWLGGFQPAGSPEPAGGWQWVNGEGDFSYTNWAPGEPNNSVNEDRLHFANVNGSIGTWNDATSTRIVLGLVVESARPVLYTTAVSPTSIRLSWNDDSSDEKGFRIQRKAGACNAANPWSTRADLGANAETFLDGQLLADTPYAYRVSRYYGAGNFSAYSRCAAATTGAAGTPQIPSILRAYSASSSRVELSWDDVAEDETAFEIYRQDGSGSMTLLDTVAESAQSFSDTTATGNDTTTSYHYDVRACNASGCSVPAPAPVVPFKPVSLKATVASTVQLTWQDKSNDESRFQIERKNGVCGSGNPWVQVGTVAANTQAYQDGSAVKGTVYAYRVRAYYHTGVLLRGFQASEAYGFSGFTGCVSATAP